MIAASFFTKNLEKTGFSYIKMLAIHGAGMLQY